MPNKPDSNAVRITPPPDRQSDAEAVAWGLAQTPLQAVFTMEAYLSESLKSGLNDGGLTALLKELQGQVARVNQGKLDELEALLVTQAYTLDTLFHQLARRAQNQLSWTTSAHS